MAEMLQPENFLPHVNKVFRVKGSRYALTLVEVDIRRLQEKEAKIVPRQPFNLIFRGPPGDVLREGMYALEVDDGPSFQLYVMPVETYTRAHQDYQSSFN
jgi:hypothetical protein